MKKKNRLNILVNMCKSAMGVICICSHLQKTC